MYCYTVLYVVYIVVDGWKNIYIILPLLLYEKLLSASALSLQ